MEAGQKGIAQLRFEAQKYGAVISEKAAAQSEVFIDSLTNLKSALTGIGKTFSSKLIPFLSKTMQKFADFWALNKQIISVGMDKFIKFVGDTFVAIKPGVVSLFDALKILFSAFGDAVKSLLPEFQTETGDLSTGINSLTGTLESVARIGAKAFDFITKISPFLKPLLTLFLVYQGLIITIALLTKGWAIAQGILNAVMSLNPLGLIILGIAALITAIIFLISNWDAVVAAFQSGIAKIWDFLSGLLDNPFIAAAGLIFAPFIAIPALIIKHWEPISTFFSDLWDGIGVLFTAGIEVIAGLMDWLAARIEKIWEPIAAFFSDLWDEIGTAFSAGIDFVMGLVEPFKNVISGIGGLFEKFGITFGGDREAEDETADETARAGAPATAPQVVSQAEQLRRTVEETRESSSAELLIRDETGRAELRSGSPAPGIKIAMARSGDA
jgi:phage-related protein